MEYRQFGRTDLKVSAIGFGCWEISGTYGPIDAAQFDQAVHRALDAGINCFDTAEAYGMGISEQALARALGARRRDVCLVTKVGVGYPEAPNRRDSSRARIMASLEQSLTNLGTDHVDVYLIHWPDPNTPFEETMRALDDIVRQGKARYVGVSNFRRRPARSLHAAAADRCRAVRLEHVRPPDAAGDLPVVRRAGRRRDGVWLARLRHAHRHVPCRHAVRRDRLALEAAARSAALNLFRTMFGPDHFPRNLRAVEELKALAAKYGKTLPQFALRWTLSHTAIHTGLVGFRRPAEVEENLGALGFAISPADMAAIDAIFARNDVVTEPPGWLEDEPAA